MFINKRWLIIAKTYLVKFGDHMLSLEITMHSLMNHCRIEQWVFYKFTIQFSNFFS